LSARSSGGLSYQKLKDLLRREHARSGWGCLLILRDDFLSFYNGGLCLDIGCDVGLLAGLVGEDRYVGLDVVYYGGRPKHFALGDAHHLPFRDGAFGFVSMIETLEHLLAPFYALLEARRVLRPGGRLFIQSVHGDDPCAEGDPTHFQSFHVWSLGRLLNVAFGGSAHGHVVHRGGTLLAKVIK